MRIRLMTFHTPKNYGAVLQGFSLMTYLKKFSDDVKVVDYNTSQLRAKYSLKKKVKNARQLMKVILVAPWSNQRKKKHEKFEKFVEENYCLTRRYESLGELTEDLPEMDIAVTGSDQVFNPSRIPEERKAFYLDFVGDDVKRISYAASFGSSSIPDEKKDEVKTYLEKFDRISVREDSGSLIVNKLTSKKSDVVLDPVFLNDKEFWISVSQKYNKKFDKYLLYYRLLGSKKSDLYAKKIAKEKGLKLVTINDSYLRMPLGKVLWDVGPDDFLGLYANADFVVTDSFHGVAFSLIFEKQFLFTDTHPVTKERGFNLIEAVGIEDIAYCENYSGGKSIDYSKAREKLNEKIASSKSFLEKAIKEDW